MRAKGWVLPKGRSPSAPLYESGIHQAARNDAPSRQSLPRREWRCFGSAVNAVD
jgi:hypothetical protein